VSSGSRWSSLAPVALLCAACGEAPAEPAGGWQPGVVHPAPEPPGGRGLLDRRGLIHAHSAYSWDACDQKPRDESGAIRAECVADFRRGLCAAAHDFVFLTDHEGSFVDGEFPDVLGYQPDLGDELVMRGESPVASWLACPNGRRSLVLAGAETGQMMPVGLERHAGSTPEERKAAYGNRDPKVMLGLKQAGAVYLAAHTEKWEAEELATLPLDGFEMYNLHANALSGAGGAISLLARLNAPEELPHPDLSLLPIINEDPIYLRIWGSVLARGARRVTTIGTDCHQNLLRDELADKERIDSYRRQMIGMSNHLLVQPSVDGSFGDLELKAALAAGRLYGAFELLGYPAGFDYRAETDPGVIEMGSAVPLAVGVELLVDLPSVVDLDPDAAAPVLTARILRAREGGFDLVTEGESNLRHRVNEPGAYRAEIRMRPRHLARWLSSFADLGERDFVWIYSNAIYVE
jgi:hypothetical protein